MMMLAPRWQKVLGDLWSNRVRTALVVLSIAVGVFAVGLVSNAYVTLLNDLDADYLSVNPRSATLFTDPFTDDEIAAVRHIPEVASAEGRGRMMGKVQIVKGVKLPILMLSVPPLEKMGIDKIRPSVQGEHLTLNDQEIFIDQTALSVLPVKKGDILAIEMPDKHTYNLRVSGIVHDVTAFSTPFSGQINAYINLNTLEWLGGGRNYTQLLLTVKKNQKDEVYIRQVAQQAADKMEKGGVRVYNRIVSRPGEHPVIFITRTLLAMLGFMGVLAVLLSAFLVVNTISALLASHIRQIGVMKSLGGHTRQIIGMYLVLVSSFGLFAFGLAVPLSAAANHGLMNVLANMLNFRAGPMRFPPQAIFLQALVALGVPIIAAMVPVIQGTRLTIREAISNYGLNANTFSMTWFDLFLEEIRILPRPLMISVRNTFRRRGRLILTLSTLTLGGAIFISVLNLQVTFTKTINDVLGYFLSDVNLSLEDSYRVVKVKEILAQIPGIDQIETWGVSGARALTADPDISTEVIMWAPPGDSHLIKPVMIEGRWLLPADENAIVVGNHFLKKRPEIKVGDTLTFRINEKDFPFIVVGIFQMAGNVDPPFVYTNYAYLSRALGSVNRASNYRIITTTHDASLERKVVDDLTKALDQAGIRVAGVTTGAEYEAQQANQINVLIYSLMIMAMLIALVGGIGLMGTMSMNVMERTREIGVMRSVGASNLSILAIVMTEGMAMGTLSWGMGVFLSLPITKGLAYVAGLAFVQSPLPFAFSMQGVVNWLVIVIVLSALASMLPAWNAVRLTVRDVLAYE